MSLAVGAILLFGFINLGIKYDDANVINVEHYKVRSGDTFWNVTEYYRELDARNLYIMEYQDEVRELNPQLKDRHYQLQPNDVITVQYYTKK